MIGGALLRRVFSLLRIGERGSASVTAATLKVDTIGRIIGWTADAEAMLGHSAEEAVGQSIELIIPQHLRGRHHAGFASYVQTGVSHLPEVTISPAVHKSGLIMKMQVSVRAVYDERRQIVAVEAMMNPLPEGGT